MADFNLFKEELLDEEGRVITDDKNDAGGLTNRGITLADYLAHGVDLDGDGDVDANDLRLVDDVKAEDYYDKNYWDRLSLDSIASQAVAEKLMSNGVNLGIGAITKLLQQAIGATVDGKLGPKTVALANTFSEVDLMDRLVKAQQDYYWVITLNNIKKKAASDLPLGLGWTQNWIALGTAACTTRDLDSISTLLSSIRAFNKTNPGKALEGNIRFIKGWLNRANKRYGI